MKPRPDVVAVHDFVKDLVDSKALACRVKDECRARVTVEPDERGFGGKGPSSVAKAGHFGGASDV